MENTDSKKMPKQTEELSQKHYMDMLFVSITTKNYLVLKRQLTDSAFLEIVTKYGGVLLLTAIESENLDALTILLDSDADLHHMDEVSKKRVYEVLAKALTKNNYSKADIGNAIIDNLLRTQSNIYIIAEILDCFLRNCNQVIQMSFCHYMFNYYARNGTLAPWKFFQERLLDWTFIDEKGLTKLSYLYKIAAAYDLQILLDQKIHLETIALFGVDLRTIMFSSSKIDAISYLHGTDFKVNALGPSEKTALHYSVTNEQTTYIRYLLDSQANIEAKDIQGRTALFFAIEAKSTKNVETLLEYGADVQAMDTTGLTVFKFAEQQNVPDIQKLLIWQYGLEQYRGVPLNLATRTDVESDIQLRSNLIFCRRRLDQLQTKRVGDSVSLYDLLNHVDVDELSLSLTDNDIRQVIYDDKEPLGASRIYTYAYKNKLRQIFNLRKFHRVMTAVIGNVIEKPVDVHYLVMRSIHQHLNQTDLMNFIDVTSALLRPKV